MLKKQIVSYSLVGVLNTLVHACVFFVAIKVLGVQSISNVIAFLCAVTFSFFMNARFTFKKNSTYMRIVWYMIGYISDLSELPALFTLVISFVVGPVLGFIFSKYLVFKG